MLNCAIFVYEQTHLGKFFCAFSGWFAKKYCKGVNCLLRHILSVCWPVYCSRTAELVLMKRRIRYCRNVKNLWLKLDKSGWQNYE
jgi:hypothetical protein